MKPEERGVVVRGEVRRMLSGAPSFRQLPEMMRLQLARDMSRIADAIVGSVDPQATARELAERLARGSKRVLDERAVQASAPAPEELRPVRRPRVVVTKERVEPLMSAANYPAFVAELLKGTFAAVVDASIQQMEAYARLIAEVAGKLGDLVERDPGAED